MTRTRSELGFRRWTAGLFDQQMWCFGRDIVRKKGNVLLDLGMCQYRSPTPARSGAMYTANVESGGSVFLWGFGAMYSEPNRGGVFVRRYDFAPKLTARETAIGVHEPEQLGRLIHPNTARELVQYRTLVPQLLNWFAKYEHWVAETFGAAYREKCLATRTKPNWVEPKQMAKEWERAAKQVKRATVCTSTSIGPWTGLIEQLRADGIVRATSDSAYRPPFRVNS